MIRAGDYLLTPAEVYEFYFDAEVMSVSGLESSARLTGQTAPTDILTFHHHDRWSVRWFLHNQLGCLNRGG